jgi:tripartite ATP-independent transporter DctP family solute receptor
MNCKVSRREFTTATAAAFATIGIMRAPAKAAQFDYKYAHNLPETTPLHQRMVQCWETVKKETNGRLEVATLPNGQLGGDTAVLTQLRTGAIQFFTLDGGILQSVVPLAAIQSIGFAFKDDNEGFRAFDGPLGNYVRKAINDANMYVHPKILGNGMRQITSSKGPVRSVADLAGFKIRTPAGALWVDLFKSLGASPIPINFSEMYTALQTRIADGQENPFAIISAAHLYEVQRYLSVTNHMWSAFHLLGNTGAWNALPPDIQAIVDRNLTKYILLQRQDNENLNASLSDDLVKKGMMRNRADAGSFRSKLVASGFYDKWQRTFGGQAWSLLEAVTGKLA